MTQTVTGTVDGAGWHGDDRLDAREAAKQRRREAFGRALSQARLARGLSQEGLADLLPVTQGSVSNWENGKNTPAPDDVFELEEVLDVPAGYLTQHLGYVPLGLRKTPPVDVEEAIDASPVLTKIEKGALRGLYQQLVVSHAPRA